VSQRRPAAQKKGPLSSAVGLLGGTSLAPDPVIIEEGIPETAPNYPNHSFEQKGLIDEVPAIDLPTLVVAMGGISEKVRDFILVWHHGPVHMQVRVTLDLRNDFWPRMHVRNLFGSDLPPAGVTAEIVQTGNNRDRFVCPVTSKPADTLFIRGGVLGSRSGLNLEYACQQWEHRSTRHKRARKALDRRSFALTLQDYGVAPERTIPASPYHQAKFNLIKLFYETRYELALRGNLPAMISIWKDYGVWDDPVEAPATLTGEKRDLFLDQLSEARARAPGRWII
jgi:hypothetical protein